MPTLYWILYCGEGDNVDERECIFARPPWLLKLYQH